MILSVTEILSVSLKCILASLRILQTLFALAPAALNTQRQTTFHFDFLLLNFRHLILSTPSACFRLYLFLMIFLSIPSPTFLFPLYKWCQFFFAYHLSIPLQSFSFFHFSWSDSTGSVNLSTVLPKSLLAGAMQFPLPF